MFVLSFISYFFTFFSRIILRISCILYEILRMIHRVCLVTANLGVRPGQHGRLLHRLGNSRCGHCLRHRWQRHHRLYSLPQLDLEPRFLPATFVHRITQLCHFDTVWSEWRTCQCVPHRGRRGPCRNRGWCGDVLRCDV